MKKMFFILLGIIFVIGCANTLKGVGKGLGEVGKGIAEDTKNIWKTLEKADKWFQEHYW
jgi:predicted small secreted protein